MIYPTNLQKLIFLDVTIINCFTFYSVALIKLPEQACKMTFSYMLWTYINGFKLIYIFQTYWFSQNPFERSRLRSIEIPAVEKCSFAWWKWAEHWGRNLFFLNKAFCTEKISFFTFFKATINLVVAYDPPANAAPNPNNPPAGDATVDGGGL